jgi:hypothetical protein
LNCKGAKESDCPNQGKYNFAVDDPQGLLARRIENILLLYSAKKVERQIFDPHPDIIPLLPDVVY